MLLKLRNVIASSSAGDEAEDEQPDTYSDHHVPIWDREARCKPWDHRKHCRPEIQKAFFLWYHENEQRFAIKLKLLRCTDRMLEIGFCLVAPVVTAWLTRTEIEIVVNWEDTFWDFLRCFETFPKRVTGGYVCDQCPKDSRPTFPSRYALWCAEVFEPFLQWVNDDLAHSSAVSISGSPDSATWAKLIIDKSE
jgi:hypothetical protein